MNRILFFVYSLAFLGCTSGFLKYTRSENIFKNTEFEKKVLIKEVEVDSAKKTDTAVIKAAEENKPLIIPQVNLVLEAQPALKNKKGKKKSNVKQVEVSGVKKRQPDIEDSEGFGSDRRPLVDPFKVGEKVTHTVSYFGTPAGILTLSVGPYLEVNGRKSYNFITEIKSSRLFSNFYSVQDQVETFVDFIDLVPHVFKLQIKESGQLKEAQSFFDHTNLKANYWENKYTEKNGHEEKKLNWEITPYSQNAFSSIFYMRFFKWTVGKEYAFRVSDDEKNHIFKAKALEKVKLNTDAGEFNAIKIKAEIVSRGALAQTGDLIFWLSDDEHHYLLRIEAKIKIGTLISEITQLDPG